MSQSSSDSNAICCVLPDLWMTSCFSHNVANGAESKTTLCFVESARWWHHGNVCYPWLPRFNWKHHHNSKKKQSMNLMPIVFYHSCLPYLCTNGWWCLCYFYVVTVGNENTWCLSAISSVGKWSSLLAGV